MKRSVLIVDDELAFRALYSNCLLNGNDLEVMTASSAEEALESMKYKIPDMVLTDVRMSGMDGLSLLKKTRENYHIIPFLIITAFPKIRDAVNALKLGAVDYLEKPVDLNELRKMVYSILDLFPEQKLSLPEATMKEIIAESPLVRSMFSDALHVAKTDAAVLITGESGTGKEVLAKFIHENSQRKDKKFIALNCASLPVNLVSSELFGYEKGAFTGAVTQRIGKVREADGGTLFLDEIGDMPIEIQPTLLRVLENKKISPVGSDKEINSDFRLIAATNKSIDTYIKEGKFREDLFYRLNVITFKLPPLRERQEDIISLANFFLASKGAPPKRLSASVQRCLLNYKWPGNVRELSNCMLRARIISRTEVIMPEHLTSEVTKAGNDERENDPLSDKILSLDEIEMSAIRKVLEETDGNQTKAGKLLGISRQTLINKMKRMKGINNE